MDKNIQIVTPVYNEEKNIEFTISSFFKELTNFGFNLEFIVSEDGSSDNSVKIIKDLSKKYKIKLFSSKDRKNYTDSVLFGLSKAQEEIVAFVDSDGQYDPKDLIKMLNELKYGSFVLGYRSPRADNILENQYLVLLEYYISICLSSTFQILQADISLDIKKIWIGF